MYMKAKDIIIKLINDGHISGEDAMTLMEAICLYSSIDIISDKNFQDVINPYKTTTVPLTTPNIFNPMAPYEYTNTAPTHRIDYGNITSEYTA